MNTPGTRLNQRIHVDLLFELERCGKYDEALSELGGIWNDTNDKPQTEGFSLHDSAEITLRCGTLIGYVGHQKQLADSQEQSKNLTAEARRRFIDLGNAEKTSEAETFLALAYWRTGEIVEAEVWIDEAFSHDVAKQSFAALYSIIVKSVIYLHTRRFEEIIELLRNAQHYFIEFGDDCLKGDFFNYYGLALRNLDRNDQALKKYKLARHFHTLSGHQFYLGTVENNIAYLYKEQRHFQEAHEAADSAARLFKSLEDKTREAYSLDTKAQIFSDEEKYLECLQTIEKAIEMLKSGENNGYLIEAFQTKIKVLIALDDIFSATYFLLKAVDIARTKISERAAENIMRVFESAVRKYRTLQLTAVYEEKDNLPGKTDQDLTLVLSPSIPYASNYQAVWIHNRHLKKYGLPKGSLALIAVGSEVERGGLAAIAEIAENSVICGFYDKEFGIVSIGTPESEPQIFDESEVCLLGSIVGVGRPVEKSDKSIAIRSIHIDVS